MPFARHVNTRRPPPFTVQLTKSLEKVNIPQTGTVFSLEVFCNKARAVPFRVEQ